MLTHTYTQRLLTDTELFTMHTIELISEMSASISPWSLALNSTVLLSCCMAFYFWWLLDLPPPAPKVKLVRYRPSEPLPSVWSSSPPQLSEEPRGYVHQSVSSRDPVRAVRLEGGVETKETAVSSPDLNVTEHSFCAMMSNCSMTNWPELEICEILSSCTITSSPEEVPQTEHEEDLLSAMMSNMAVVTNSPELEMTTDEHSPCAMMSTIAISKPPSHRDGRPPRSSALSRETAKWEKMEQSQGQSSMGSKVKKSVRMAEEKNEVRLVQNWIDPSLHQHKPFQRRVRFWSEADVYEVERDEDVGYGHTQLHFPKTKHSRVCDPFPNPDDEDQDGDILIL